MPVVGLMEMSLRQRRGNEVLVVVSPSYKTVQAEYFTISGCLGTIPTDFDVSQITGDQMQHVNPPLMVEAPEHWEPATWAPGSYHGWTLTNQQTTAYRAHQRIVRRGWESRQR